MNDSKKYWLYQTAINFNKEKDKFSVDTLLCDNYLFDEFIHDLAGLDLDNASGGSYGQVFLGFYKDGVLLGSEHRSDHTCSIEIASKPDSIFSLGEQESRYYGNPHPLLKNASWVTVWDNRDKKLKSGPWVDKVKEVIQYALDKAEEKANELIKQKNLELEQKEKEKLRFEEELNKNWQKI